MTHPDSFEHAFSIVVGLEGGYVFDPRDPGGETKYGISKRAHPGEDIRALTLERAREIYRSAYWEPAKCYLLPDPVALQLFDAVVNHGVGNGVRMLQRALGVADDGIVGPVTIGRSYTTDAHLIARRLAAERLDLWTRLSTWGAFGKGWARRAARMLREGTP